MADDPGGFDPGDPPGDPGTSESGGSSGGGGSSSGGSSAPAQPKTDIYISDTFKQDAMLRQKASMFAQIYQQLWGEPALENYIVQAVKSGMNSYEFALAERAKPAWTQTKAFKDSFSQRASFLKGLGL